MGGHSGKRQAPRVVARASPPSVAHNLLVGVTRTDHSPALETRAMSAQPQRTRRPTPYRRVCAPWRWLPLAITLIPNGIQGSESLPPLADVHMHYNWDQAEVTSPVAAARLLRAQGVALAVVASTPPDFVLRLKAAADIPVVALYSPYEKPGDWSTWRHDRGLPARARAALDGGAYGGIGEAHFIPGFGGPWDTPVVAELAALAARHDVPFMMHTESLSPEPFIALCRRYPDTRILWAHSGAVLSPSAVAEALAACPNVMADLSARDPWRFISSPIAQESGKLRPEWLQLVLDHPSRFMVGSDALWPVEQLHPWDEPDTGWQRLDQFLGFHRGWLRGLPATVAERVRYGNAVAWFAVDRTSAPPPPATGEDANG